MAGLSSTTPLVALDAVVIDTETTGLDPRRAWIVEVAGVRLVAGRLDTAATLQSRVRPPVPIPAVATSVHGIDDAADAGCDGGNRDRRPYPALQRGGRVEAAGNETDASNFNDPGPARIEAGRLGVDDDRIEGDERRGAAQPGHRLLRCDRLLVQV